MVLNPHRRYVERETRRVYERMAEGTPEGYRTDEGSIFYAMTLPLAHEMAELSWVLLWPWNRWLIRAKNCAGCQRRRDWLRGHLRSWREFFGLFRPRRCTCCKGTGRVLYHGSGLYAQLRACSCCSDGRFISDTAIPNVTEA